MSSYRATGFSIVEVIVAAAIIVTIVTAAAGAWQVYLNSNYRSTNIGQAGIITEETAEALRYLRDTSWTTKIATLTNGTTYQLYWDGSTYQATTSNIVINRNYIRTFTLSAVNRDGSYNIVTSGGSNDADSRKITVAVSLLSATSTPLSQVQYLLHNVYAN